MVYEEDEVCEFCENNIRAHEDDWCEECAERMERESSLKRNGLVIELTDSELNALEEFTNRSVIMIGEILVKVLEEVIGKLLEDYNK